MPLSLMASTHGMASVQIDVRFGVRIQKIVAPVVNELPVRRSDIPCCLCSLFRRRDRRTPVRGAASSVVSCGPITRVAESGMESRCLVALQDDGYVSGVCEVRRYPIGARTKDCIGHSVYTPAGQDAFGTLSLSRSRVKPFTLVSVLSVMRAVLRAREIRRCRSCG